MLTEHTNVAVRKKVCWMRYLLLDKGHFITAHRHEFSGKELADALKETFENRHTSMDEIVALEDDFAKDPIRKSRWRSFVKKKKALLPITMEETIETIRVFLLPVVESIRAGKEFKKAWNCTDQMWS